MSECFVACSLMLVSALAGSASESQATSGPFGRSGTAQSELGAAALYQSLLDVGTDMRLMCVAAHPDDEDGATLAVYRRRYGVETHVVIATRGEGGQNETGTEWDAELGVVRTWEMARAAELTGSNLHYLNLPDFGFSKSPDEAFAVWGHDATVERLVRVIREVRPDVIITHHGRMRDHGHHQALGAALLEAYDRAADAAAFPEAGAAWQASRLYIRSFEPIDGATVVDSGKLDPIRGVTYAEIAAEALRRHASQGMGFAIERVLAQPLIHYELVRESTAAKDGTGAVAARGSLFEGMPDRASPTARGVSDWAGAGSRDAVMDDAARSTSRWLTAALERAYRLGDEDGAGPRSRERARISRALAQLEHLRVSADVADRVVVPGQTFALRVRVDDFGRREMATADISVETARWVAASESAPLSVTLDERGSGLAAWSGVVAADARPTAPYAERLHDDALLAPAAVVRARALPAGSDVPRTAETPVYADVAAPVEATFMGAPYIVPRESERTLSAEVRLLNRTPGPRTAEAAFSPSQGLGLAGWAERISFQGEDASQVIEITSEVPNDVFARDYVLTVQLDGATSAHALVRVVDVAVQEGLRVGVIRSYDDTLSQTLGALGVAHAELTESDFAPAALDRFDTVLVDLRAYLVREDLVANHQALLDFAARGGTVVVMYQKTFEWRPEFAPYPLRVSANRATREDAPVTLLAPDHELFDRPNLIGEGDWLGWRQERGLYFADEWAEQYAPLIAVADPGESLPPGALLEARHGQGRYVYTGLAWYRQLRDGLPGALRLFANLISLGHTTAPETAAAAP